MSAETIPPDCRVLLQARHQDGTQIRVVVWPGMVGWRSGVQMRVTDRDGDGWRLPSEIGPAASQKALAMITWGIAEISLRGTNPALSPLPFGGEHAP